LRNVNYQLTLAAPRNHFLFTPLLPSTTVGTLEFRSILEPFRRTCPWATFHLFEAVSLDVSRKVIQGRSPLDGIEAELPFDDLIIAVGAIAGTFGVPGVAEHALFLREVPDSRRIRRRILDCLERASAPDVDPERRKKLLHFVVVGGGPTGVEFSAEMHDFLWSDLKLAYPNLVDEVRITILEATHQLLGVFDQVLSDYTAKRFARAHITVRTKSTVIRVEEEKLYLQEGEEIPFGLLIWATGNAPNPFTAALPFAKEKGRLLVDEYLRVKDQESIYALGDCALVEGNAMPATGQVAEQQGKYLAQAFRLRVKDKVVPPFFYRPMGMLAYVGGHRAVADLPGIKGHGFGVYLFWRSVYLTKLISFRNKVMVVFGWLRTFLFGRDLSRI
jgi:NADH:ubiquinone reductase (non-electrogenic)